MAGAGGADGARAWSELQLPGRFQADNAVLAAAAWRGVRRGRRRLTAAAAFGRAGAAGARARAAQRGRRLCRLRAYARCPSRACLPRCARIPRGSCTSCSGAGGDRDAGKRPLMGWRRRGLADRAIVTDDNPRGEDPARIRAGDSGGLPGRRGNRRIRRAAIAAALDGLAPGDVLVVAGKGHEQGQIVQGEVIPFDDAAVIRGLGGARWQ